MRNASDIFCLDDQNTDGMQMFSVNGNCPMKIKRRNHLRENEVFEYGRSSSEQSIGNGNFITDKLESGDKLLADESGMMESNETMKHILHDVETQESVSAQGDQKKHADIEFHKLNHTPGSKEEVTTSTILRNPLTGAGMEIQEHRKPKKGSHLNDKWMW